MSAAAKEQLSYERHSSPMKLRSRRSRRLAALTIDASMQPHPRQLLEGSVQTGCDDAVALEQRRQRVSPDSVLAPAPVQEAGTGAGAGDANFLFQEHIFVTCIALVLVLTFCLPGVFAGLDKLSMVVPPPPPPPPPRKVDPAALLSAALAMVAG